MHVHMMRLIQHPRFLVFINIIILSVSIGIAFVINTILAIFLTYQVGNIDNKFVALPTIIS